MLNTEPPSSSPHFPSGGLAGPVPETPKNVGAETLPLTAINARSKREGEASPGDRSSLLSAKDRNRRINRSGASSRGISNVPPGSWRRNTNNSDFSMGKDSGPFARTLSNFGGDHTVHVSTISPGPVYPHQNQLAVAYGYAVRREDGTYTRLVRADEIVGLTRVPPTQESCEGLIVLPPPELPHPDRRTGSQLYATAALVRSLPQNLPSRPKAKGPSASASSEYLKDKAQRAIDQILATNPIGSPPSPNASKTPRRQKIYCDKWIHEGVCAFTQLGCKFKHEMPMDRETQMSLGLNHGLPSWYKRAQAVHLHPELQSQSIPSTQNAPVKWRRSIVKGFSGQQPSAGAGMDSWLAAGGISGEMAYGSSRDPYPMQLGSFGPIGPPPPPRYQEPMSNNPYATLPEEGAANTKEEDDEETITWSGRRH